MITKNRIFGALALFAFIVSCTTNNDDMVATNKITNKPAAAATPTSHKLIINNDDSDFKMDLVLVCYGTESNLFLNPEVEIKQNIIIEPHHHYTLNNFETAYTLGIAGNDWEVNDGSTTTYSHGDTLLSLPNGGQFVNGSNAADGYFTNWAYMKGDIEGTVADATPAPFTLHPTVSTGIDFVLSFANGQVMTGLNQTINLVDFEGLGSIDLTSDVSTLTSGDTFVVIHQSLAY